MAKKIKEIMQDPVSIDKNQPISIAMDKMDKNDLFQIPVTNNGIYHGSLSYHDIARELGSGKKSEKPASSLKVSTAYKKSSATVKEEDKVIETFCAFSSSKPYTLTVVNENKVKGIVRSQDILQLVEEQTKLSETNITSQEYEVLKPDDRVVHARRKMIDNEYTALPVIKEGGLAGLITNKEIAIGLRKFRKLVPDNKHDYRIRNLLVKDIMNVNPTTLHINMELTEIAGKLTENDSTDAVVIEDGLKGILSHLQLLRYWCGDER